MRHHGRWLVQSAVITLLLLASTGSSQVSNRIFFIGNSVTDMVNYGGFQALVLNSGNGITWGRNMIPGAPLSYLWENTAAFVTSPYGPYQQALVNYAWDCLSLQPFDRMISGSEGDSLMMCNFMNLAKTMSPQVQTYIYQRWPRDPLGDNNPATNSGATAALWNQLFLGTSSTYTNEPEEVGKYFDSLCVQVRKANLGMKQVSGSACGFSFLCTQPENGSRAPAGIHKHLEPVC